MRQGGVTDADLLNFMMGHEMPYGGAYDKFDADYILKEYAKAEPYLTVMVSSEVSDQIELKAWQEKHAPVLAALPEETRVKYNVKSPRDKVQFLKPIPAKTITAKSRSEGDGRKRAQVIDESEAENRLNHGYEFVTVLPSGKLLVKMKE